MKLSKPFWGGLLVGGLAAGLAAVSLQPKGENPPLAEMQGETLTLNELRPRISSQLLPIENDEYAVLESGIEGWIQEKLVEKEARARGISPEKFYQEEVWAKVNISLETISAYYNQNKELFGGQPLENLIPQLSQQLRQTEYARQKENLLVRLREKYQVKIQLERPESYVEGLSLPAAGGSLPAAPPGLPDSQPSPPAVPVDVGNAPVKGSENAPLTMVEFVDFHCGFCKKVAPTLHRLYEKYQGKMRWVFKHYPLSAPGAGSFLTHRASMCAHEQGKFWEYAEAIFALPGSPAEEDLKSLARKTGLDMNQFEECLESERYDRTILDNKSEGIQKGVQGTPSVFINDQAVNGAYPYEHFEALVESILDPTKPAPAIPAAKRPAPAPERPPAEVKFTDLEGRPALGPKNAPVTIVEYSDFMCPFCKRVTPTIEQLYKNYKGKIRRVWRHYPLSFHQGADRIHEASECAHEQGKFWEYHDKVFEKQGTPFDEGVLKKISGDIGLNRKKFDQCLESGKYKELIQKETAGGSEHGVQGTPAFFINGKPLSGAQPYENFEALVKSELGES